MCSYLWRKAHCDCWTLTPDGWEVRWGTVSPCLHNIKVTVDLLGKHLSQTQKQSTCQTESNTGSRVNVDTIRGNQCVEGRKEMFYLTTHSTHFIYGYMASDIWLRTILIVRKETRCRHIGYCYRLAARVLLYAPSHRQDSTYHGLCYTSRGALAGMRTSVWMQSMFNDTPALGCRPKRYILFYTSPTYKKKIRWTKYFLLYKSIRDEFAFLCVR